LSQVGTRSLRTVVGEHGQTLMPNLFFRERRDRYFSEHAVTTPAAIWSGSPTADYRDATKPASAPCWGMRFPEVASALERPVASPRSNRAPILKAPNQAETGTTLHRPRPKLFFVQTIQPDACRRKLAAGLHEPNVLHCGSAAAAMRISSWRSTESDAAREGP